MLQTEFEVIRVNESVVRPQYWVLTNGTLVQILTVIPKNVEHTFWSAHRFFRTNELKFSFLHVSSAIKKTKFFLQVAPFFWNPISIRALIPTDIAHYW